MPRKRISALSMLLLVLIASRTLYAADLIPPVTKIKSDRPRVLLRPKETPYAISLSQLKATAQDADFKAMLAQLRNNSNAAAQAMVWLLSGEKAAADKAVARMRAYRYPGGVDTFHIYGRLCEFGLAYDWLYNYEGFTEQIKAEVRANVLPLGQRGFQVTNDHVFHNYVWMSAGGTMLWALATAGEDDEADKLFAQIRQRMNQGLFPAMQYLDGLPSEPMGYWALYDFSPAALALLGAQSAFETDLIGAVEKDRNNWLSRHFANLVHSTLPNMRYIPWGDMQSGPNGSVTHEMAGMIDAMTWALRSPQGAYFSSWLAKKRGLGRFYGETAVYYMLYSRHLKTRPGVPPLSFLAGNKQSGHFIARSGWDDGATIVAFRATDHFGDHNHYDQGSFLIYRNGLLAVDPPVYRRVGGPQQKTEHHNTLLLGGQPQRPARGQWFQMVEEFQKNLTGGRLLETGDVLFSKEAGPWAAVAGQFAQAYAPELVRSCIRQLLFVRPDKIVVVDHFAAPPDKNLPEIQWLLQLPSQPTVDGVDLRASNGESWIRCRPLLPNGPPPTITATPVGTHRASYSYRGNDQLTLVHLLELGDGEASGRTTTVNVSQTKEVVEVALTGKRFIFARQRPFGVSGR